MIYQIFLSVLLASVVYGQTLELQQRGIDESGAIEIAVVAHLQGAKASGISFYVALPAGAFEVIRADRPYLQGPLLSPAMEFISEIMPEAKALGAPQGMVLLPYAAVRGPGADRGRAGEGVVARFALRPLGTGPRSVYLINTPIYETKLVLDDGVGEQVFQDLAHIELEVPGPEREKPAGGGLRSWGRVKIDTTNP